MKILLEQEVPQPPQVASYNEIQWRSLVVGISLFAAATALIALAVFESGGRFGWLVVFAAVIGIMLVKIGRYAFLMYFASQMSSGWRLRWSGDGLYIRFRSYLNRQFDPETPTTIFLPWPDIVGIEPRQESLSMPTETGGWSNRQKYAWLELSLSENALSDTDVAAIKATFVEEANRRDRRGRRYEDHPVSLQTSGAFKIRFIQPLKVLAALGISPGPIEAPIPATPFDQMSPDEGERHIQKLVDAGELFAAVKALRQMHGLSLTDARKRVDEMRGAATPG